MISIMSVTMIDRLAALSGRTQTLAAGDVLFRTGDQVVSLYLVTTGALRLTRVLPHGFQLTIQRAGPGAILAEASLFATRYHCDASADQFSELHAVPVRRIKTALADDPVLAAALAQHLAQEVQRSRAHAEILSLKTVAERVYAWMALNNDVLPPKGQWRQMASEIGVTPEALYRDLARRR